LNMTNRVRALMMVVMGIVLLPTITLAGARDEAPPNFSGLQWIWALFSLVIVVIIAYWVTKTMAGKLGYAQAKHLKVAESLFLGPNRHLYLLLFEGKVLLVGSSEGGIQLLKELDDPGLYEELQKNTALAQPALAGKFPELFNSFQRVLTNATHQQEAGEEGQTPVNNTHQRLLDGLERIKRWKMRGKGRSE
jgi:flagellar biogenesis protein FliO